MADDLHRGTYMADLLLHAAESNLDRPAVYLGDRVLTGREMRDQISRFAQALASQGIGQGSPIAVLSPNRPEVLFNMGANMITGTREWRCTRWARSTTTPTCSTTPASRPWCSTRCFGERAAELQARVPTLKRLLAFGPTEVGEDYLALAAQLRARAARAPDVDPDAVSGLAYTGGTTGKPKGVMSTYRSAATMTMIQMAEWQWPEEVRFLIATPLSHAGAAFFVPTLLRGGSIYVLPDFDPGKVLEAIEEHKITATMLVPTMLYMLLDHPRLREYDLSSLETIYYGAAAMSPTRLKEAIETLGPIFFQFYGQAECPMTITVLRKEEHDPNDLARLATCGRPVPWVKVALLDDDCNEVPQGEPGEICVRGPLVMAGYWNKPEQTEEALQGRLAPHRRRRPRGRATASSRSSTGRRT